MFWWLPVIQHKVFVWAFWRAEQFARMRVVRLRGLRLVISQSCSTTFLYEHFGGSSNCQTLFFRLCCPQFVLMASNWVAESSRMGNSPNRAICPYVVVRLWGPRFVLVAFSAIRLIALKALSSCPFPVSDYEHTRYKPNDNKRRRLLVFG